MNLVFETKLKDSLKDKSLVCKLYNWSSVVKKYRSDDIVQRKLNDSPLNFVVKRWHPDVDDVNESMIYGERNAYQRIELLRDLDPATLNIAQFLDLVFVI